MTNERAKNIIYIVLVISALVLGIIFLYFGMTEPDWHDFDVFYGAAKAALTGKSIYIIVGEYDLPFWYLPWTAWSYIPFALLPHNIALTMYKGLSVISAVLIINSLLRHYNPGFKFQDRVLILSLTIPMSFQMMIVGQMEFLFLGIILFTIFAADKKRDFLVGLLFPLLLTKPHLIIIFTVFLFWHTGIRAAVTSFFLSALMLVVQTAIQPGWHIEMFQLLQAGQKRVDGLIFTTLPNMLGSQENWIGTANLPFTMILIFFALLIMWKFRSMPTIPLLSMSLTASLFCAPRAYAYDLPLLIPTMIWLTASNFGSSYWIWLVAGIFPMLTGFSTTTYLVTLLVFLLGIKKAYEDITSQTVIKHSQ